MKSEIQKIIGEIEKEYEKAKKIKTSDEALRADVLKTIKAMGYEKIKAAVLPKK